MKHPQPIVSASEFRAISSALLAEVKQGGSVLIGERRRPIARLVPTTHPEDTEHIAELSNRGVLRIGNGKPGVAPRVTSRRNAHPVSDLVIEDRR